MDPIGTKNNDSFTITIVNEPKENLVQVCEEHASSWGSKLAQSDYNCTQDSPETCPPTTLCCLNKCFGSNNDEENTFKIPEFHCEGQLYCQKTNTCHYPVSV